MMLEVRWTTDAGEGRVEVFDSWQQYADWQTAPTGAALAARQGIHGLTETELTGISFEEHEEEHEED